ncbi:MAG TPA: cupredoxin domain-containing protein [Gemmatimonadaceae bacterium]|nr:cupredoxin domain-containing protein [Gemmatimonadaceae bacterium]
MNRLLASAIAALGLIAILDNAAAAQQQVAAMGKQFSTSEVRVASDEMVIFVNQDKVVHQVFSTTTGLRFNLKRLPPGAASGVRFTKRGVAEVRCAIHRDMQMKVVVE